MSEKRLQQGEEEGEVKHGHGRELKNGRVWTRDREASGSGPWRRGRVCESTDPNDDGGDGERTDGQTDGRRGITDGKGTLHRDIRREDGTSERLLFQTLDATMSARAFRAADAETHAKMGMMAARKRSSRRGSSTRWGARGSDSVKASVCGVAGGPGQRGPCKRGWARGPKTHPALAASIALCHYRIIGVKVPCKPTVSATVRGASGDPRPGRRTGT